MAWVEQAAQRIRKAKFYQDSADPARKRVEFGIADRHYHDGAAWQDIDEALVDDGVDGFAHKNERTRHVIRLGTTGTRRWYPRRDHHTEYVEFGRLQSWSGTAWGNVNLGTPTRSGNTITWDTTNFRLTLTNTWRRVKIVVVLKTTAAVRRLRWAVSLSGLTWDAWQLRGADDVIVGTIDRPTAWDANGSEDEPNVTITTSYSGGYVEFGGDLSGAVLPITIDPTFTDGYGGDVTTAKDTYLSAANTTTNYGTSGVLVTDAEARHALIEFDLSSIPADATCNSAILSLWSESSSTAQTYNIFSLVAAVSGWTEAGATWATYDGSNNWPGSAGASTSGTDYEADGSPPTITYPASSDDTEAQATLDAARVEDWFGAINTNYGIIIGVTGSTSLRSWHSSDAATTDYRPKLVVDYTEAAAGGNPYYAYAQQ